MIGWNFGNCEIVELLGQGATSRVFKVTDNDSGLLCALKYMSKHENDDEILQKTKMMVEYTKPIDFPFICKTFDSFETDAAYAVECELCEGGNLMSFIQRERQLKEDTARIIFYELMLALQYLHTEVNMLHRDLKLENVLLDRFGHVRLGDFGLSAYGNAENPLKRTRCGTPAYAAPEVIKEDAYYSKADIWSAGVILFTMVAGAPPFSGNNVGELFHAVVTQELAMPNHFSMELKDLLRHVLDKNSEERYAINEIISHPWLSACGAVGKLNPDVLEKACDAVQSPDVVVSTVAQRLGVDDAKVIADMKSGDKNTLTRRVYRIIRNESHPEAIVSIAGEVVPGGITVAKVVRRASASQVRRGGGIRGRVGGPPKGRGRVPGASPGSASLRPVSRAGDGLTWDEA